MNRLSLRVRIWLLAFALPALLYGIHRLERDRGDAPAVATAGVSLPSLVTDLSHVGRVERDATPAPEPIRETRSLGPGGTLAGTLEALGLTPEERQRSIAALREQLDLRRLPAATGLSVARNADGSLKELAVRADAEAFVRLTFGASGEPTSRQISLSSEPQVRTAGGRVIRSVHQALASSEHAHELTLAFADVFQWDIDLLIEPRAGDEVRIVYETHHLTDVPDDLPPFGDHARRAGDLVRLGTILAAEYDGRRVQSNAYRVIDDEGSIDYFDADGRPLRKTFLKSPLNYRRISSRFSHARRHPITRKVVPHHGVDFAAAAGTPVVAAADGRVESASWQGALGRAVRIRHGSDYVTIYGHLKGYARGIRAGSEVRQNQVIGYVGASGRATGPHLHYTLLLRGRPIDPMALPDMPVEPLAAELRPRLEQVKRSMSPLLRSVATSLADAGAGVIDDAEPRRGV